ATPLQQGLDPDARPLRPLNKGERLAVPGEHLAAVVSLPGRVIAEQPGTRQVPRLVEPSPLRVLAQRKVDLSLQRAPKLLIADGRLSARAVRPGASLIGHVGPPRPRHQTAARRPREAGERYTTRM